MGTGKSRTEEKTSFGQISCGEYRAKGVSSRVDEGRKRVIGIMASILTAMHMRTADDLFGTPQGSPRTDKLKGFVELAKFEELLAVLPPHLQPYIMFLYHCGGRSGEAELIEWSQVDLEHGFIRLEDDQTKNDEARIVPLPKHLIAKLWAIEPKEGLVFDTTNLRKEWQKGCAAVGLGAIIPVEGKKYDPRYEGLTLHDFRRSAARNLLLAGVPETIIMRIGGWKTRSVFDRYAVASTADLTAAMQRWEATARNLLPKPAIGGKRINKQLRDGARA